MADTVLAHIAASNPQKENLATEALAFIMNRSRAATGALHRQVAALLGDVPPIARVTTQTAVSAESRPDVELFAEDGRTLGYVEAKFWAALTDAQPVKYVRDLTSLGGGILVFLAPERRLPTLRWEIIERLTKAELAPTQLGTLSMMVGPVRIGLLSWPKVLSTLQDSVAEDRDVASDVHQLRGLVARVEVEGFVPLTRSDLDDLEVPRRMIALADLASDIVDHAVAERVLDVKGLKATHFIHGSGRYAAFRWAGCWLGLNHEMWSTRGRTPIWINFLRDDWGRADPLREPLRAWLSAEPPRAYVHDENGCIYVPVLLAVAVEKDRVVADAVRQLRELDEVLRLSGLPPLKGEAPTET